MSAVDPATLSQTCRKLFLRDHVVEIMIGAHDFEKIQPQRVIFNVELFVPYAQSTPHHDTLAEVVDYDFVREVIRQRVQNGHIVLQETLCDDLATQLLAHPQVVAVRLSSCKPDVYPDCAGVGVEVFRTQNSR
ncbi:MAG: dihydroneopterin aldolase [Rhodoferax sp.]|uniref:dihydroneopterin aldolase n=1 Tax=Rhodoferax sp. TaxID=50421 RepID=UPI001B5418CC|nr:dihydroneopterin aldolase [Rhodoferax sp.]MBP9906787.1 dihydroneopterin aldolase [Rhodoferax sp.]